MSYKALLEYTFPNLRQKQRYVTDLFPTFPDRVRAVSRAGGLELMEISYKDDVFKFKCASVSNPGSYYIVRVHFFNPIYHIQNLIQTDSEVWADKETLDYELLAHKWLEDVSLKWDCSCPADTYWGFEYNRTQKDAKYTRPENRPPKIRNPGQKGFGCKHLALVFNELGGVFLKDVEKYLKRGFKKLIDDEVAKMLAQRAGFRNVADWLKAREEKEKEVSYARGGKPVEIPKAEKKPEAPSEQEGEETEEEEEK